MTAPNGFRASGFGAGAVAAPGIGDPLQAAITLRNQGRFQEALDVLSGPEKFPTDAYTLRGEFSSSWGSWRTRPAATTRHGLGSRQPLREMQPRFLLAPFGTLARGHRSVSNRFAR